MLQPDVPYASMFFKSSDMPRIACIACGQQMHIELIEPLATGFEVRSYYCFECSRIEKFITEL